MKEELLAQLRAAGHEVVDFGAHGLNPGDDYPDFVIPLAQAVAAERWSAAWQSAAAASGPRSVLTRFRVSAPGWCTTISRLGKGSRTIT
ncbi:MAG TPA: RpiB/LacA/LacB family sugar-phosphate isomerase [Candidatus Methylomirabilis sp.]|nr:RpiB/LacA/LacB family sugar-phosphate isomerase [Candidatus Methylomirabilis sp.]